MKFKDLIKKTNRKFTVTYLLLNDEKQREYLKVYPAGKATYHNNRYTYQCYYRKETKDGKKLISDDKPDFISEVILRNLTVEDYH